MVSGHSFEICRTPQLIPEMHSSWFVKPFIESTFHGLSSFAWKESVLSLCIVVSIPRILRHSARHRDSIIPPVL